MMNVKEGLTITYRWTKTSLDSGKTLVPPRFHKHVYCVLVNFFTPSLCQLALKLHSSFRDFSRI
jgi:hypothetical protein